MADACTAVARTQTHGGPVNGLSQRMAVVILCALCALGTLGACHRDGSPAPVRGTPSAVHPVQSNPPVPHNAGDAGDARAPQAALPSTGFERLKYMAVYESQPFQTLDLTVEANGHATLRFGGNTASDLFPHGDAATREGQVAPEDLARLQQAVIAAHLEAMPARPGALAITTQQVQATAHGATLDRIFSLHEPPGAWQPAAAILQRLVATLLAH